MHNQMQMQDPEYAETMKGKGGNKGFQQFQGRENMGFTNPHYFGQQGGQGDGNNYYKK